MNLPAAVLAAMALCNQHVVATRNSGITLATGVTSWNTSGNGCLAQNGFFTCPSPTTAEQKAQADAATEGSFRDAFAWEAPYQAKCLRIQTYVEALIAQDEKREDDAAAAKARAAKAAEQPTLDKGIAALKDIKQ